eukprot:3308412-Rhodomonas_salina.1
MFTDLGLGLELHVHGVPKWMRKMNPDKMNSSQAHHIVRHQPYLLRLLRTGSVLAAMFVGGLVQ